MDTAFRDFMAKVAEDYFDGSARKAETVLGWNRRSVQLRLDERRTGMICVDNYQARGRYKTEEILPNIEADTRSLVDAQAQADPKLRSPFLYARISAKAVREALMSEAGYDNNELPSRQTTGEIRLALGVSPKKTQKTKPLKKIPQTDAIFENVFQENQASDENPKSLRPSIDTKAYVKIGKTLIITLFIENTSSRHCCSNWGSEGRGCDRYICAALFYLPHNSYFVKLIQIRLS